MGRLTLDNISAAYGNRQVLFDLNLVANAGCVTTLLGRNGMGKTTTINAIMGIVGISRGEIRFGTRVISRRPLYEVAAAGIGLVPEGRQIFPNLSVRENLVATARAAPPGQAGWQLDNVLAFFPHLAARLHHRGDQLSGGEQQMLAIGRALMLNPQLLILDEATEGLAPQLRQEVWQRLRVLKQTGLSILIVDKNIDALCKIAESHYIIEKGRIVWQGNSAELQSQPQLQARYLGVGG